MLDWFQFVTKFTNFAMGTQGIALAQSGDARYLALHPTYMMETAMKNALILVLMAAAGFSASAANVTDWGALGPAGMDARAGSLARLVSICDEVHGFRTGHARYCPCPEWRRQIPGVTSNFHRWRQP